MPLGIIQFECREPTCKAIVQAELYLSNPDFGAERMSDGDAIEDHDVTCEQCGTDYEIETVSGFGGISASIDGEEISIEDQHDPAFDDYDDFLGRYEPANDTVGAYELARNQLLALIAEHGTDPTSILNRMVYSQVIAAMEAYLSDKILRLATDHIEIKRRILTNAGFLKDQTLKLKDIMLDPSKAETTFKVSLQRVLYHDLEKVEKLYQIALAGAFYPPDPTVKTELERAILIRHDCVHRNGADLSGTIHQFDEAMITLLTDKVTALVDHLEDQAEKAIAAL